MGKIFYVMGKSSSGKDTIYKDIRKDLPELKTLTLYTTRPMREGEKDGASGDRSLYDPADPGGGEGWRGLSFRR